MKRVPLWFAFFLALFFSVCTTVFFPNVRLIAFSPFLAILYHRTSFLKSLWIASLCGVIIDLCCSQMRLGIYAVNYAIITVLLYKHKRHFFEDKSIGFCLFTALISSVSTLLQLFMNTSFGSPLPLCWQLIASDILLMPCLDGLYAYLGFVLVMRSYEHIQRIDMRAIIHRLKTSISLLFKNVAKPE